MFSIDAAGKPDAAFRKDRTINLRAGMADKWPGVRPDIAAGITKSGDLRLAGFDRDPQGPPGDVRAFGVLSARCGGSVCTAGWKFSSDAWEDSWKDRGSASIVSDSVDPGGHSLW